MAFDDERLSDLVARERSRLLSFIRRRVPSMADAEDVLQDVFQKLVQANSLLMPIDHATGWLFRVARNRITDLLRERHRDERSQVEVPRPHDPETPDTLYARKLLFDQLAAALDELPRKQREVFIAHEIEGRSFKEIARATGESVNTLLARKRYAVLRLRTTLNARLDESERG